jgi:hypothetical protein
MRSKLQAGGLGFVVGLVSLQLVLPLAAQGRQTSPQPSAPTGPPVGRFQTVWNNEAIAGLGGLGFFLIDSATGRVWRYEVASATSQETQKNMAACKTPQCFVEIDRVSISGSAFVQEAGGTAGVR